MRRALIVGSEFGAADDPVTGQGADEQLTFVPEIAEGLTSVLAAAWTIHGGQALLNPTAKRARKAIRDAVAQAAQDHEPLLLAFLGHGVVLASDYAPPDFYLKFRDSAHHPSDASLHLIQYLKEQVSQNPVNGLVLLVDACSAGAVPINAALKLSGPSIDNRLEILVASGEGKAFNCCFSKTLTDALRQGIARAGETVHPANVYPAIATACHAQEPAHMSYTNGYLNLAGASDPALWLVPNRTRSWHALLDRPDAGILDQVTGDVQLSTSQKGALQTVKDGLNRRLRLITGPAGSGKTTILATLVKPQQDKRGQLIASNISAAVFLSRTSTPEATITELADQISRSTATQGTDAQDTTSIPSFATARRKVAQDIQAGLIPGAKDLLDRELILPLADSLDPTDDAVQLVIDGLDQAHVDHKPTFHAMIERLTTHPQLERLRVIAGIRQGDQPLPAELVALEPAVISLSPPVWSDVSTTGRPQWLQDVIELQFGQPIPDGWLTIRLLEQLSDDPGAYDLARIAQTFCDERRARLREPKQQAVMDDTIELLCVTGIGPVLPTTVLRQALNELGHRADTTDIGTVLATLGPLILRGRAGYSDEHVGFAHLEIAAALSGVNHP